MRFRSDSLTILRRVARIGQYVFSGKGEGYGCLEDLLLWGNAISKVVNGVFH